MTRILTSVVLLVLLIPSLALGETVKWDDLVEREGLLHKKFTDVPFSGTVTGKRQGKLKDGKKVGPWVRYHDNGKLFYKGVYKNGKADGPWVFYRNYGQSWDKGTIKNGKRDGPWVSYGDNGLLSYKETYKDGEREGPWVGYHDNGTVWKSLTGTYKNDVKVK